MKLDWIGAHCLRHACAGQLLDAGFTLKQIADHLGHRSMSSTRIYTKIDVQGLRQVAELDLGGAAMSTASTIADYIRHNRSLGKRFVAEAAILSAFSRSVGKMPLRDIRPATITRFVNREGISAETIAKKHGVLAGFFRYAVTRRRLKASPMPSFERRRVAPSFTPYIYSEAELKRLLAAVPAATGHTRSGIDADTLRTFVLLLYGAGLRRGEARRLKVEDVDLPRSLLHIKETKFFKTRIVPISASLSEVLKAFVAKHRTHGVRETARTCCSARRTARL